MILNASPHTDTNKSTVSTHANLAGSNSGAIPPSPSLALSSGGRALAELSRREQDALTRIRGRNAQIQTLEQGIAGHYLGLEGADSFIRLTPTSDDEQFFKQFYQNPALAVLGANSPSTAPPTANGSVSSEGELVTGAVAVGSTPGGRADADKEQERRGILSSVADKVRVLGWLSTSRLGVGLASGLCFFLGLICFLTLVSLVAASPVKPGELETSITGTASPVTPTQAPLALNLTPTVKWEATITAQAVSLATATAQASLAQPKATVALTSLATATAPSLTPTPVQTALLVDGSEPHGGLLAPSKLAAPKLSFANDRVRRYKAEASANSSIQAVVSSPGKGEIYHLGAYPGERPGNVVFFGDYDSLGKLLELLQINDTLEVTDRNGGVYVYRVLPWEQLNTLVLTQSVSTPMVTAIVSTSVTTTENRASAVTVPVLDYRVEKVTDWQDTTLVSQPVANDVSVLTLVSLNQPGEEAGRRYAVRARFVSYRPVPNGPAGTPVSSTGGQLTPAQTLTPGSGNGLLTPAATPSPVSR